MMCLSIIELAISTITMLAAVGALVWAMIQFSKQSQMNTFLTYTQRYQEIMMHFPIDFEKPGFTIKSVNPEEREDLLRWIRAYFDLCSEEYHLSKEGFVCERVWKLWEGGMVDSLRADLFLESWLILQREGYYAEDFSNYVDQIQNTRKDRSRSR